MQANQLTLSNKIGSLVLWHVLLVLLLVLASQQPNPWLYAAKAAALPQQRQRST
jgi:hypothetical protein